MFGFFRKPDPAPEKDQEDIGTPIDRFGVFAVDAPDTTGNTHDRLRAFHKILPGGGMHGRDPSVVAVADSADGECDGGAGGMDGFLDGQPSLGEELYMWYARQGFIGHQLAALVAQHWLVERVCFMPGDDAIRKGWDLRDAMGRALPEDMQLKIREKDIDVGVEKVLQEYVGMGRVFGIRIAIPDIDYEGMSMPVNEILEAPFNIDGVRPGKFKGWIQVDPYWTAPELDAKASAQPNTKHFYVPTWWLINGQRYHRSHLQIFINGHLADILKPAYLYGGLPVPQLIMERVYAAERVANEAPLLALTKRTTVYKTDLAKATANFAKFAKRILDWSRYWSNNGIRVGDRTEDEFQQFDTSLADLDAVIMTSFQLVAAAGKVPGTKLLGTSPKGFNSTGQGEADNYHEFLESLQKSDLTPFLRFHYKLVCKSLSIDTVINPKWHPMDAPTELEHAQAEAARITAAAAAVAAGVVDGSEERQRLNNDEGGMYAGLLGDGTDAEAS